MPNEQLDIRFDAAIKELRDIRTWLEEIPIGTRPSNRRWGETLGFYSRRQRQRAEQAEKKLAELVEETLKRLQAEVVDTFDVFGELKNNSGPELGEGNVVGNQWGDSSGCKP